MSAKFGGDGQPCLKTSAKSRIYFYIAVKAWVLARKYIECKQKTRELGTVCQMVGKHVQKSRVLCTQKLVWSPYTWKCRSAPKNVPPWDVTRPGLMIFTSPFLTNFGWVFFLSRFSSTRYWIRNKLGQKRFFLKHGHQMHWLAWVAVSERFHTTWFRWSFTVFF